MHAAPAPAPRWGINSNPTGHTAFAGTFGEAFKGNGVVLKIVPMEGSCLVRAGRGGGGGGKSLHGLAAWAALLEVQEQRRRSSNSRSAGAGLPLLKPMPTPAATAQVNGEPQKRADEILAEVSVTLTLSRLNGRDAAPGALRTVGRLQAHPRVYSPCPAPPAACPCPHQPYPPTHPPHPTAALQARCPTT